MIATSRGAKTPDLSGVSDAFLYRAEPGHPALVGPMVETS